MEQIKEQINFSRTKGNMAILVDEIYNAYDNPLQESANIKITDRKEINPQLLPTVNRVVAAGVLTLDEQGRFNQNETVDEAQFEEVFDKLKKDLVQHPAIKKLENLPYSVE